MKQNNSIFTRVLSLVLCILMFAGVLTACFQMPEFNPVLGTPNGVPTPDTTTGDVVENEPNEDPVDPVDPEPVDPNVIFSASTTVDASNLMLGTLTNDVVIGGEGATALVPADVMVESGASSLALTLKNVEENDVDFGDAELLNNLDVHISGIAANNTVPMTVALGAILEAGLGATELKLYHIENGEAVLMTRVESASDFAIHNQYTYDAETGEVTIYVSSFSVFAMVKATADVLTAETEADTSWYTANTEADEFTLDSAADFIGFRNLVDTGVTFAGKTVKLGVDIDLNKINFDPIGYGYTYNKDSNTAFMGTFDGQGHTIYNLYEQGWDLESATGKDYTYSTAGAGLFASIENATIKNLVVSGADIKMECVDMGIVVGYAQGVCHFENIVVTNSKIANYQRATGGVVGEVCYGPYGIDIEKGYSHTFKNIVVDSSVTVGSLWGDFDNLNGGVIGGKWGDATVEMDNVTVAVTLDAYSDVTSAYQWYAYRRSGMLIGHTEQNSPKKSETADAPFLTCKNVKVYYGDWVNYTYCQFEHANNPGYRYPWVRVQVGLNNGAYSNPRYGNPVDFAGNKVTTDTHTHAEGEGCNVLIKFDQLYGGGQGVYGKADHDGVTVVDKNTTTIYIKTSATNLKLFYWYDTTWTNVVDGIELVGQDGTFRADIPAYAYGFKLIVDGVESEEFILANHEDGSTITLGGTSCTHTSTTTRVENETASSCTETGSYDNVVYCTECEEELSRETVTVNALGHTPGAEATCTTAQTCTVCSAVIKADLGHTEVVDAAVAATCTATGLTEGKHCAVCEEVLVAQTVVDALGHTEVVDDAVAATCTTTGLTEGKHCSVCDEVLVVQTVVAALGHDWKADPYKCSGCGLVAEKKTVYFQNNWNWTDVRVYYWCSDGSYNEPYPGVQMTLDHNDGTYNIYRFDIPAYADSFNINGIKNDGSGYRDETPTIKVSSVSSDYFYYMNYNNGNEVKLCPKIVYLVPNSNWKVDNARFAAYFFNNSTGKNKWVSMTWDSAKQAYKCNVPDGQWEGMIFCRMNPNATANNWDNKWNQSGDLTIPSNGNNTLTMSTNSSVWDGFTTTWSKK